MTRESQSILCIGEKERYLRNEGEKEGGKEERQDEGQETKKKGSQKERIVMEKKVESRKGK